jgi:hypothetical protein
MFWTASQAPRTDPKSGTDYPSGPGWVAIATTNDAALRPAWHVPLIEKILLAASASLQLA